MPNEKPESLQHNIDLSDTNITRDCLAGEVAVITGSTSSVGFGFAQALAWAGAKVVITGRNDERGYVGEKQINDQFGEGTALYVHCDMTNDDEVKAMCAKAIETFGKVDILINNAMNLTLNGKILSSPVSDLDMSYMISAHGSMVAIKELVPAMIERGHGVVTYSTTQFNYQPPMVGGAMYTTGKACATSLHMSLASECDGTGVNVFCFMPAGVGVQTPESVAHLADMGVDPNAPAPAMRGFHELVPPQACGASMVHCILNADKLHKSTIGVSDALVDMDYPFPVPETAGPTMLPRIKDPMAITLLWLTLGEGFGGPTLE